MYPSLSGGNKELFWFSDIDKHLFPKNLGTLLQEVNLDLASFPKWAGVPEPCSFFIWYQKEITLFPATEAPVRSPEESCMDRAAVRRTKAQSHLSPGQSHFASQPQAGTVPCFACSSCILLHSRTTEGEHYDVPYPERVAAPYTLTREQQQSPIKPSRKTAPLSLCVSSDLD